uniref:Uncharacterized protein n=1 Tax=Panagrellus redivivus TaxID=6233 RepID=A0A7E4W8Y2_PANRE
MAAIRKPLLKNPGNKQQLDDEWPLEKRKAVFSNTPEEIFDNLRKVTDYIRKPDVNTAKGLQNLIEQSVFCLTPDRKSTRLTPVNQFKLLNAIVAAAQFDVKDDQTRRIFFITLFLGRANDIDPLLRASHESRMNVLVRFCSLAVQYPVGPFLDVIGVWLAEEYPISNMGRRIATELVNCFLLKPIELDLSKFIDNLLNSAFSFAAVFLFHAINSALIDESRGEQVLAQIAKWISTDWQKLLKFYNAYPALGRDFAEKKFPYLMLKDCTNDHTDETHERLHVGVICIIVDSRKEMPNAPLNLDVLQKLKETEDASINSNRLSEVLIAVERTLF